MRLTKRAKRRALVVALILVLGVCGVSVWRVLRIAQIQRLSADARAEGMRGYHDGDYETALARLGYYLRRKGRDLEALLAFAESRSKLPEPNSTHLIEAARLYSAALRLDLQNHEALKHLMELYRRLGLPAESMEIADRILALDSDDIEALVIKGAGLFLGSELDEALEYARKLIELEPGNIRWRASLREIRRAQGAAADELISLCDSWLNGYEGDGRFHLLKAQTLVSLGRSEEARQEATVAAELGADSLEVLEAMIHLLDRLELREEADKVLSTAKPRFGGTEAVIEVTVHRLWQAQRTEEAITELNEAEEKLGALSSRLLRWKALLLLYSGRGEEAEGALASLLELVRKKDPEKRSADRAWAEALRARIRFGGTDWLQTLRTYQRALALQPQDAFLHYLVGEAYRAAGEHELAAASFESASKCDPHWMVPQLASAKSLLMLGRATETLSKVVKLLRRYPDAGFEAYLLLARAWFVEDPTLNDFGLENEETGRPVDLVELLEALYQRFGQEPTVAPLLVDAYLANDQPEAASELIEEALALQEPDPRLLVLLARASELGGLGLEQRLISKARKVAGLTLDIAEAQGRLLHREGHTEEGLSLIEQALASSAGSADMASHASRLRAAYLVWTEDPRAGAALGELLGAESTSAAAANFVLSQPTAWRDPELISRGIDRLEAAIGEQSPRVLLARATFLLKFESQDAAKLAQAIGLVGHALKQIPDSLAALRLMSKLLLAGDQPDLDQAVKYLRRAIERYPQQMDLYLRLIALLQQQGDFDVAERYLRRLREHPDLDPRLRRAEVRLLKAQGNFDTAAVRLGELVDASSAESEQLVLATLQERAGNYAEAERIYQRLLSAPDHSDTVVTIAAEFYANTGRFNEGLSLFGLLEPDSNPAMRAMRLGVFHQMHGDLNEAGKWLREAVRMAPDNAEAWLQLAKYCLAIGNYEEAREAALSGRNVDRTNPKLRALLAVASLNLTGQARHEALDVFRELEWEEEPWLATVTFYDRVVDDEGTFAPTARDVADVRELVHEHPQFLPAWRLAVTMHAEARRIDEAVQLAKQAMTRLPTQAEPAEWATRLLIQAGQLAEALEIAQTWRRRSLEKPIVVDTVIASLQLDLGRPRSAVEQLAPHVKRIWYERDRFPGRVTVWLRALLFDRQLDRAASLIQPLAAEAERWRDVWLALARAASPDIAYEALLILEPALLQRPEDMLVLATEWADLAQRTAEPSHYDRAEELVREVERDNTFGVRALLLRGSMAVSRGELDVAEQHYRRALEGDPDNSVALNNLAYVLIELRQGYDEAHALSARAINLAPNNPDLLDTHAQALAGLDRLDEAERTARLALAQRSDDPALLMTLTRILMAQSRLDEAEAEMTEVQRILTALPRADNRVVAEAEALRQRIDDLRAQAVP